MNFLCKTALMIIASSTLPVIAQDSPKQACNNAAELYNDGDFVGALEEAKWCVTLLEQEQQERIIRIFPDTLEGFEGGDVEHQSALGFSSTVRKYSKEKQHLSVTLSSGNGMGTALAALSQFGAGGKKTRIQKRSANVIIDGRRTQVLITLKKGGLLMFESQGINSQVLIEFANAFPVAELDESR